MSVSTWDPKKGALIVTSQTLGTATITGYADGTFLTIEQDDESYSVKVGADGEVARARKAKRTATVKVTLMATAISNEILTALHDADEVFGLLYKDGDNTVFSADAWVSKPAAVERGVDVGDAEWTITLAKASFNLKGNP